MAEEKQKDNDDQGFIARAIARAKTVLSLDPKRLDILERVDRINPSLNAIVTFDLGRARSQADAADAAVAAGVCGDRTATSGLDSATRATARATTATRVTTRIAGAPVRAVTALARASGTTRAAATRSRTTMVYSMFVCFYDDHRKHGDLSQRGF